jgi:hypothetical protein
MSEFEEVNTALVELQNELEGLQKSVELIGLARHAASETITGARELTSRIQGVVTTAERLNSQVASLIGKIDGVDFPTRLDKLDATTSGINAAVQAVHMRLESAEGNLRDAVRFRVDSAQDAITKAIAKVNANVDFAVTRMTAQTDILKQDLLRNRYVSLLILAAVLAIIGLQIFYR